MKTELVYLTLVTLLTGLMWVPYVLNRIAILGLAQAAAYPTNPKPQAGWAVRLMKAHSNAVENLVIFAPLVLVANAAGISNAATATACVVYFWARLSHAVVYTFAIPWARTVTFAIGVVANITLAIQILNR